MANITLSLPTLRRVSSSLLVAVRAAAMLVFVKMRVINHLDSGRAGKWHHREITLKNTDFS
jgi:hypothetical protein